MVAIYSATPRANLLGIEDLSTRTPLPEGESTPMHLPMMLLFAQKGPSTTQLVTNNDRTTLYGADTFDYRKSYANHATVVSNTVAAQGNAQMIKRLIPDDAKQAFLGLYLEIVEHDVPQYQRNPDNTFALDVNGDKIDTGNTESGYKLRWYVEPIESLGAGVTKAGSLAGRVGMTSTCYPILEFGVTHVGVYGQNIGLSLTAPSLNSSTPVDDSVITDNEAYLYRIQFVERPSATNSPSIVTSIAGEQYVEFSFKEGVINSKLDKELHIDKILPDAYRDIDTAGYAPIYGPMDEMHCYSDHIATVLALLTDAEAAVDSSFTHDPHMYNFISGKDFNDIPYYSVEIATPADGGILMDEGMYQYATGGADGDLSLENFDQMVGQWFSRFTEGDEDYMDDAAFPMSTFYDSGFTLETKKRMLAPIGARKDLYVIAATQDVQEPQNTASEEQSIAIALRAAARLYPESAEYGTATCRAIIVGHSGYLLNSNYTGLLPLTVDLAQKCAAYMGSSVGVMDNTAAFDESPLNQVSIFKDVNCTFKSAIIRNQDWNTGLVWVQRYDRRSLFYPAFQTVYDNDTSVINSAINMMIAVELQKVCLRTWRDLTGNTKLTVPQFIERSNSLINQRAQDRFDGRVIIVPETYMSDADTARGYSWSCRVNMYANNMMTVGTFTVTAYRRQDL